MRLPPVVCHPVLRRWEVSSSGTAQRSSTWAGRPSACPPRDAGFWCHRSLVAGQRARRLLGSRVGGRASVRGGAVPARIPPDLAASSHGPASALSGNGGLVSLSGTHASAVTWEAGRQAAPGVLADPVAAPGGAGSPRCGHRRGSQLVLADVTGSQQVTVTSPSRETCRNRPRARYSHPDGWTRIGCCWQWTAALPTSADRRAKGGKTSAVEAAGLARLGPLSSLSVSRDGTRIVVVSGSARGTPAIPRADHSVPLGSGRCRTAGGRHRMARVPTVTGRREGGELVRRPRADRVGDEHDCGPQRRLSPRDARRPRRRRRPGSSCRPCHRVRRRSWNLPAHQSIWRRPLGVPRLVCAGSRRWILDGRSWAPRARPAIRRTPDRPRSRPSRCH